MIHNNTKLPNGGLARSNSHRSLGGFTIVELMIATTVFSVILLLCATALVQIGRIYYKGVLSGKTQNTARSIMDEIASSIKYSGGNIPTPISNVLCVGNLRYSFNVDYRLTDTVGDPGNWALIVDKPSSCLSGTPRVLTSGGDGPCNPPDCRELLSPGMRLSKFNITPPPDGSGSNLYGIDIGVVSGEDELLNGAHTGCGAALNAGGQFCAASELTTYVQKRL